MTIEMVTGIARQALEVTLILAGPVLLTGLIAGVFVSLLQAMTHINDMTLSLIPKMVAVILTLTVLGPWMLERLLSFTRGMIQGLPGFVR